ncbi:F0F1-type ATP synthase subunit B [Streptococcus varani]|uniref:ATP synthase subunit b n=1 Tax=Streptococcus varani TaxID=1608583 RepID=A0A0E4CTA3_9STRE|nr:F0F1 ATP synthase subunit B [Streptococcus varani]CQR25523.1 F0F1-type ATP synthase subunit B [Streptococcus varani]
MITVLNTSSTIIGNFILVTASFLTLIILIRVFAWKNLTGIFEQRAEKIAGEIDEAEEKNQTAAALVKQRQLELDQGRIEGKKIVQDAVARAKVEKKHIIDQAAVEAQGMKDKAKLEIQAERREAQENLKIQVASLAVDIAGKIILEDLDQAAHSALIDRYIDRLGEK